MKQFKRKSELKASRQGRDLTHTAGEDGDRGQHLDVEKTILLLRALDRGGPFLKSSPPRTLETWLKSVWEAPDFETLCSGSTQLWR